MRNKGIIEIKSEETRNQIIRSGHFPLYYYLKIQNDDYININVNIGLNNLDNTYLDNNFEIKGYILDEDTINRKINGEYIQLGEPIYGYYSNKFNTGIVQVNKEKKYNDSNYLLIEIINIEKFKINSFLLVQIVTKENNKETYFMPIYQYLIETFNDINDTIRNKNKYHIYVNQRGDGPIFIEMSPEYNDIDLIFTNETMSTTNFSYIIKYETGFKKYIINNINDNNIYFDVINPKKRRANFMIRYHYHHDTKDAVFNTSFYLSDIIDKQYINTNDVNITLSLTFDPIYLYYKNEIFYYAFDNYYFYISGLLYKKNENSEELLNTTSILYERHSLYENQTINIYYNKTYEKDFTLIFENIPREENYTYDLQIQVFSFMIYANNFISEFLIYTKEVDLTDIKIVNEGSKLWYILGPVLGFIFLLIVTFFVVKYIRLQRANINLKEDLKSIAYSNDIQKNVLSKEKQTSEKESDYDSTFI